LKQLNSSKNNKSSNSNLNKTDDHFNRGIEFILSGGKRKQPKGFHINFFGGRKMVATDLVLTSLIGVLFLLVGLMGGWILREYMLNYQDSPKLHPEFYDQHGNIVADEVIAVSFQEGYFDKLEEEEE
tara:strand:- start:1538 stop:1918 length:381 start_codon:yes stop_codon:yes gene_type:complete